MLILKQMQYRQTNAGYLSIHGRPRAKRMSKILEPHTFVSAISPLPLRAMYRLHRQSGNDVPDGFFEIFAVAHQEKISGKKDLGRRHRTRIAGKMYRRHLYCHCCYHYCYYVHLLCVLLLLLLLLPLLLKPLPLLLPLQPLLGLPPAPKMTPMTAGEIPTTQPAFSSQKMRLQ